jgi:hypothetical protein
MRIGIIGGSIAGCATAALLHRVGHDVIVFERSESDLVSRGAGIVTATAAWQDMMAHGLIDGTLPACRADYSRFVTRAPGTGQQRWLGDVQMSFTLLNWGHLYQHLRRRVPDDLYRSDAAVERIEATPHGTTLHLLPGGSLDFDLVVCADGYRSLGRGLIDPGAAPVYRGMVLWRGLLPETGIRVDALDGCDLLRPCTRGVTGWCTTSPDPGRAPNGENAFSCGATTSRFRRAPWPRCSSTIKSGSSPARYRSGRCIRRSGRAWSPASRACCPVAVRAGTTERQLLDPGHLLLCGPQLRARASVPGRRCRYGVPPFTGSGVLRAVANATSLTDALAGAPAVDDALRRWSQAQIQVAAQVIPIAEGIDLGVSSVPPATVAYLASLEWITAAENLCLVGPAGTGKSHLLVALGAAAVAAGHKVRYYTAAELTETLYRGLADNSVGRIIDTLLRNDLILIDEVGFAPLDDTGAQLLFRVVAAAYERRALGIASHWPFESWGRFLPEHTTAVSLLDRLLHHANVVVTDGDSYRMREARARKGTTLNKT